jgi:ankyrin repeat protein
MTGLPEHDDPDRRGHEVATDQAERVERFLQASVRGPLRTAVTLLVDDPGIATYDFRTAIVLGDAPRVRDYIARDPGLLQRRDERTGWPPLLGVCNSRWHRDPARARGLLDVATLLLDAGADPNIRVTEPVRCGTLFAAAGCAHNPSLTRLLLDRGAVPDDETLYLAAFPDDHECLRLLLPHVPDIAASTALSAPISTNDVTGARLLLDAGVDPNTPLPVELFGGDGTALVGAVAAAVETAGPDMVTLLLDHGADPNTPGRDGHSPYRAAIRQGRTDLAELLAAHGARTDATDADHLLAACLRGDEVEVGRLAAVAGELTGHDQGTALVRAAENGDTTAVTLMLGIGFDIEAHGGNDGATALHAAAGSGSVDLVRLLIDSGADLEAVDRTWQDTPLGWAIVGSGLHLGNHPHPNWPATVQLLIDAGADLTDRTWTTKPPSDEVATLLAAYGIGPQT